MEQLTQAIEELFMFYFSIFQMMITNRIAEIIFQKCENVSFLDDTLDFASERGVKCFGSSGL